MIHQAAFWLAILPPTLAILVEYFNPINGTVVRANADRDLRADFGRLPNDDREELLSILELSGAAIAEVSGLAPTLIAATTSGFAIIHELDSPFWPAVSYVLIFTVLTLYILWLLSGLTFAQIGGRDAAIPAPCVGGEIKIPFKRTTVVSLTIYVANVLLIVLAVLVFSGKEEYAIGSHSASLPAVEREKELQSSILQHWVEKTLIELRLNNLQDQITYQEDEIAKRNEPTISLKLTPASESSLGLLGWRRMQAALCQSGFNPGPVDGSPGPRTRGAIRQFQRMEGNGTRVNGHLTTSEIAKLWSIAPAASVTPNCP